MIILDEKIKELLVKVIDYNYWRYRVIYTNYLFIIKIEEAGEEGRVQEAQILTKEVETLQKDLDFLKNVSIVSWYQHILQDKRGKRNRTWDLAKRLDILR